MGFFYLKSIALFIVSWLVYSNIKVYLKFRALRKWGNQHGCAALPAQVNKLPWGVERIWVFLTSLKSTPPSSFQTIQLTPLDLDFLDDIIVKNYHDVGSYTYRAHVMFFSSVVLTAEPENIQTILATSFADYELGAARANAFEWLMGKGIFTAEREQWAHFRRQLKPQFTRDQVSDLEAAERHLNVLFKALPEADAEGWVKEADLLPLMYNFTLDASTEFLFGKSVNSQSAALHAADSGNTSEMAQNQAFVEALDTSQQLVINRLRFPFMKWVPVGKEMRLAADVVKTMAGRFVTAALSSERKSLDSGGGEEKKFVLLDALSAETRDPIELRDQALHLLLAGRDTTASLLGWAILLLARDAAAFAHLRQTVLSHFGTASSPSTEPSFESLKACKEITHVLYEALRLYSIVPINGRTAIRNTVLPRGGGKDGREPVAVMKGETVGYAPYVMHRRKDIWGEDADVFRPERWEGRKLGVSTSFVFFLMNPSSGEVGY